MEKTHKLEDWMLKGRRIFFNEQKKLTDIVMITLLRYRLYKKEEDKLEIKRFFHSIKGTAGTLNFKYLSHIGKEYEEYINYIENDQSDEFFSKVLKGVGKVHEEMEKLKEKYNFECEEEKYYKEYASSCDKGSIFVVDEDIRMLDLVEKVFTKEGYRVFTSSNPNVSMSILKKEKIDLMILDIMMPGKNGFQVLEKIRKENFNIPIIFLTAHNLIEDKVKALKGGVDDYITKPFEREELVARVERILKKSNSYKIKMKIDNLTGVYNKKYLHERLEELKNGLHGNEYFSIAFIDLDYFKQINDKYGHLVGDHILQIFTKELQSCLRNSDEIYRFGGDEFLVLFHNIPPEKAYEVLERVRKKIQEKDLYYKVVCEPISVSFSAGVASLSKKDETLESILDRADKALYASKKSGRGKITYLEEKNENKRKILLIDDSNTIVQIIKTRLTSLNYDVYYANDGEEGVRLSKEMKPDLMILDLILPKLNGFEVCKKVKKNLDTKHSKIIILSSNCKDEDVLKCFNIGVDEYMIKPFSLRDLEDKINRLLE